MMCNQASHYEFMTGIRSRMFAIHEIHRLRTAGERVPNALWWRRKPHRFTWVNTVSIVGLIIFYYNLIQIYAKYSGAKPPYGLYMSDFALLMGIALSYVIILSIMHHLNCFRRFRLWNIKLTRRRLWRQQATKQRRAFFSSRVAPRRLALLLGLAIYLILLAAAAGVGNMPPTLIIISAAVGHARVLPIVLFPLLTEITVRRRLKQRLMDAERS